MKNILIGLLVLVAFGVSAQKKYYYGYETDTLSTSTSIDTFDVWLGGTSFATAQDFVGDGMLTCHMVSDSINGATAAVGYLEYFYTKDQQTVPYRAETFTNLNGATQQSQIKEETQLGAYKVRARLITTNASYAVANSSQNTRVRFWWNYKED